MKKLLFVVLGSSFLLAGSSQVHIYDIKSGKVTYEIKGSGNIMGSTMKIIGKKRLIFDNYGASSVTEENKIQKQNIMGQSQVTKSHTMTYMKNGVVYVVDFDQKSITRMENMSMGMAGAMGGQKSMAQVGLEMLKKMGGKKVGTDKVLGYSCEVWDLKGIKQCIYKGVTLKTITNFMGLKTQEVVTKAEFDISIPKDSFKLPDFPIYDMMGTKLDRSKLDSLDKQAKVRNEERKKDMQELGNIMAEAAKKAGIKNGAKPTKEQEKAMEEALKSAMLPRAKQEVLEQEKVILFAKECFESANSLKEARSCEDKLDKMQNSTTDPEDRIKKWDSQAKKEMLEEIKQGLKIIECAKRAKSVQEMDSCTQ